MRLRDEKFASIDSMNQCLSTTNSGHIQPRQVQETGFPYADIFLHTSYIHLSTTPPPIQQTHTSPPLSPHTHIPHLRQHIPAINQRIAPRLITTRLAGQVKINPLDLPRLALAAQHGHAVRLVLNAFGRTHRSVEKTGADDVDSGEFAPFAGQRAPEV